MARRSIKALQGLIVGQRPKRLGLCRLWPSAGVVALLVFLACLSFAPKQSWAFAQDGADIVTAQDLKELKAIKELTAAGIPVTDVSLKITIMIDNIMDAIRRLKSIAILGDILELIETINGFLDEILNKIEQAINNVGTILSEALRGKAKHIATMTDAEADAILNSKQAGGMAEIFRKNAQSSKAADNYCKRHKILQGVADGEIVAKELETSLTKGYLLSNRSGDPTGPEGTANALREKCKNKHGHPMEDKNCASNDPQLWSLDEMPPPGSVPLKHPKRQAKEISLKGQKITVDVVEASSGKVDEQLFVAARNNCYYAAGPIPKPPNEKEMAGPNGAARMAMYQHCVAAQSLFINQCFERVAYLTRPNCKDNEAACKKSAEICLNAKGLPWPEEFGIDKDGKCPEGLSKYEQDYITHVMCQMNQAVVDTRQMGEQSAKLITSSDVCYSGFETWELKQALQQSNLLNALRGLHAMKECWSQVE